MNKISANNIQMFVAGALAVCGFDSLIRTPYDIVVFKSVVAIGGSLVSDLALLIGVAILVGSKRALSLASIYLLLEIGCGLLMLSTHVFRLLPDGLATVSWWSAIDLLSPAILFALLAWSRSKHFRDEPVA